MIQNKFSIIIGLLLLVAIKCLPAQTQRIPHLRTQGEATQLIVDGEPFLMLGGELGNSSASSLEYMKPIWPKLVDLNLNTVLAPVYWELIEPEEGQFDFSLVDGLIKQARVHNQRLVLLWFGSWKNSMSSYVPDWVKQNPGRYPRAEQPDGTAMEILSPFSEANVEADTRAFEALMKHLRELDGDEHTVIMVQVENEIGMIPKARDHSPAADKAYAQQVPAGLMNYLQANRETLAPSLLERWKAHGSRTSGTWEVVFGEGTQTEELFMAWNYARYVEQVTSAGKAVYPLPMYVNAALIRPGYQPGEYPSAGPLPHLVDVWRAGAPSIDFLAPDIYFPNFVEWVHRYDLPGNPLFIPEAGRTGWPESEANAFYAFGAHNAMGYSPFSIEDAPGGDLLCEAYETLDQLTPLILKHQRKGTINGVKPTISFDGTVDEAPQKIQLGKYVFNVSFIDPWTPKGDQQIGTHGPGDPQAGILRIEEGRFVDGQWERGRVLNGDQSHQGRHLRLPPGEFGIQRLELYRYN